MGRYFLEIKYDGTNYHGWQIQQNAPTVQAEINQALSTLLQSEIKVTGAGRTDAGVHAQQLFAHFDAANPIDLEKIQFKLNTLLPNDISCSSIVQVAQDAHARFNATARTYEYWISPIKNPFLTNKAYFFPHSLDLDLMNEAAQQLLRYTDFSCFSKSNTDTFTNNCKIEVAKWENQNDRLIFTITADRFLRNMVRAVVGTLIAIGQQKLSLADLDTILASKDRGEAGTSVPAHGLYLTKVDYPREILIVH